MPDSVLDSRNTVGNKLESTKPLLSWRSHETDNKQIHQVEVHAMKGRRTESD